LAGSKSSHQTKEKSLDCNDSRNYARAELLFRITTYFEPDTILEIGTSLGLATAALALGSKKSREERKNSDT
jgi:predicted O-methyltransferase YrrM